MSCLNLRLPPAKKAWRSFTTKLQTKLHKLHNSKAIKKRNKYQFNPPPTKAIRCDEKRSSRLFNAFMFKRRRSCRFILKKKTAPVYVDKLFRDLPVADEMVTERATQGKSLKFIDKQALTVAESAGASKEERKQRDRKEGNAAAAADDMWESLGFASPLMRGIDERAEQFISSFRAEMEVQELIETELCIENASS
ncbi:uncharacterized protein LOC126656168 [Mercurialis annua]|uniref:uncharacterized protein LOC126656168 n=1 Tax=Mercurialis annua TaxID=3986 RepID=UPI0021600846|nr:uncharacterized protein LOC126656168 [Mercurialis annua]